MKTSILSCCVRLCCAAMLLSAGSACSEAPKNPALAPAAAAAPALPLSRQIEAAIGDAACDSPQQCHTLALGHKACGGPESYVAWSGKRSDGARLSALAAQLAAERKRADEREGMMSTCTVVLDPGATCSAGKCVLQQRGAAAPAVM